MIFEGSEVMFCAGASKAISNWELDLYLKCGKVTEIGVDTMTVTLNEPCAELDEWHNQLIWTIEDCIDAFHLNDWERMCQCERRAFFAGFLAGMVTE